MLSQVRRWLPDRAPIVVADSGYAVLDLLHRCQALNCQRQVQGITMITRLRLDAALYAPAPERKPGQTGRPRKTRRESACRRSDKCSITARAPGQH